VADTSISIYPSPEAGNIIVDQITGNMVRLKTDRRDTEGHWFYWRFRIEGANGRTLCFIFDSSEGLCLSQHGPAVSNDSGRNWRWLGAKHTGMPDIESFIYTFSEDESCVEMAFCFPYLLRDWQTFCADLDASYIRDTLCLSRKGRKVPLLRCQSKAEPARPLVLITGRHHCCESGSGPTIEGLLIAWSEAAASQADLMAIPFVDLDGVEEGDQGKNRKPHDHNRDYNEVPIYPEVAAIMKIVRESKQPIGALDLHCPYARGGHHNGSIYFVGQEDKATQAAQDRISAILEAVAAGLPYEKANNVPFGTKWNVRSNYESGMSFAHWCAGQGEDTIAMTLEIPYADASGTEVTPERLRTFGRSLAHALAQFLADR
jgi:hypothetical protein